MTTPKTTTQELIELTELVPRSSATATAQVTGEPIDEAALCRAVLTTASGALVIFSGIVRDHDQERSVRSLDYQAHPDAELLLTQLCERFAAESGLRMAAAHRVGALQVGDVALYVVVASSHRKEAFDTAEQLVEEIKHTIPIWKRQHFTDGVSEWVGL
ncbi:molybdenum cofactor biosynthesis protein MoaE [Glaciibacter superstes]|uniref:molybdenum cofactor biosynthesis protein MoaE n=1 Tax=Glaciibacter superstes TaxID=501023 RepID=UPI0003B65470|nr:molybdenum cofactor biosynthesis protein MoaE [Glaciibacter superstes]